MGNHRHRLSRVKAASALLLGILIAMPANAADCPTGLFRAVAGPDTASMLEIGKDGHFRYGLSEGAVDETAEGRWECADGVLLLTTEPTPKPAQFRLDHVTQGEEAPFSLIVTWPDGNAVAGVDFKLDFDRGDPAIAYTQPSGWATDLDGRVPKTIQFAEPFYGTVSPVFPVPPGKGVRLHVVLEPNDMGIAAFSATRVRIEGERLLLEWRGRAIPYERQD